MSQLRQSASSSSLVIDSTKEDEDSVVETDPSGRYSRYNSLLGKGAYKEVYKAFDEEEGLEVAWNQLRIDHLNKLDANRILKEISILKSLRNDNIINLYHAWGAKGVDGRERVYFVTELMTAGTLKSYLKKTKGPTRLQVVKKWCRQILNGLHYLHSRDPPIIHRDLKCENIFINGNNGQAKIGDLGLAVPKSKDHVSTVLGTPEFMAPELYEENYNEKVDIYAFGMVVLEMVTKEYPYSECNNQYQIFKKVSVGIKPIALSKVTDDAVRDFIEWCITFDHKLRPSTTDLLASPFLKILDIGVPKPMGSASISSVDSQDVRPYPIEEDLRFAYSELTGRPGFASPSLESNAGSLPRLTDAGSSSNNGSLPRIVDLNNLEVRLEDGLQLDEIGSSTSNDSSSQFPQNVSSVLIELIDKTTDAIVTLRMVYTVGSLPAQQIMFPFNLPDDTATDVVSEMVREQLIDGKDEVLARRKLEEAIKSILIGRVEASNRASSVSSNTEPESSPLVTDFETPDLKSPTDYPVPLLMKIESVTLPNTMPRVAPHHSLEAEVATIPRVSKSKPEMEAKLSAAIDSEHQKFATLPRSTSFNSVNSTTSIGVVPGSPKNLNQKQPPKSSPSKPIAVKDPSPGNSSYSAHSSRSNTPAYELQIASSLPNPSNEDKDAKYSSSHNNTSNNSPQLVPTASMSEGYRRGQSGSSIASVDQSTIVSDSSGNSIATRFGSTGIIHSNAGFISPGTILPPATVQSDTVPAQSSVNSQSVQKKLLELQERSLKDFNVLNSGSGTSRSNVALQINHQPFHGHHHLHPHPSGPTHPHHMAHAGRGRSIVGGPSIQIQGQAGNANIRPVMAPGIQGSNDKKGQL